MNTYIVKFKFTAVYEVEAKNKDRAIDEAQDLFDRDFNDPRPDDIIPEVDKVTLINPETGDPIELEME